MVLWKACSVGHTTDDEIMQSSCKRVGRATRHTLSMFALVRRGPARRPRSSRKAKTVVLTHPAAPARTARHAEPRPLDAVGACQDDPVAIVLHRRTAENDRAWLRRQLTEGISGERRRCRVGPGASFR